MVKQGHNKQFRKCGAKVTCISMQHVGGSEDMLPSPHPPLAENIFQITCSELVFEASHIFCNCWQTGFWQLLHRSQVTHILAHAAAFQALAQSWSK